MRAVGLHIDSSKLSSSLLLLHIMQVETFVIKFFFFFFLRSLGSEVHCLEMSFKVNSKGSETIKVREVIQIIQLGTRSWAAILGL